MALASKFGREFGFRLLLGFGSDGAEQSQLVLGQQIDGALRQGIALSAPAFPADVGMDVFGVEADSFQNPQGLGQNLVADSISGHSDYGMFCHDC